MAALKKTNVSTIHQADNKWQDYIPANSNRFDIPKT